MLYGVEVWIPPHNDIVPRVTSDISSSHKNANWLKRVWPKMKDKIMFSKFSFCFPFHFLKDKYSAASTFCFQAALAFTIVKDQKSRLQSNSRD